MNNASGLSPFFLVTVAKLSPYGWRALPRERRAPLPLAKPLISSRPARRTIVPPPGLPPMFPINVTRRGIGCGKDFSIFPLSPFNAAQGVVTRARPSVHSGLPSSSSPSVHGRKSMEEEEERRRRMSSKSTYVGKDVSISRQSGG